MAMEPAAVVAMPPANAIDVVIVITIAQAITEAQSKRDTEAKTKITVAIAVAAPKKALDQRGTRRAQRVRCGDRRRRRSG